MFCFYNKYTLKNRANFIIQSRCGAQFCYVCGDKWKTCECPWFNYETVEADRELHMRERLGGHQPYDAPPSPPRNSRLASGMQPQTYNEELRYRRLQEERDEAYARRLASRRDYDDEDFMGGFGGEINGLGNAAGHFLNDDFRPRARPVIIPPQPPAPPPLPIPLEPPVFDRAATGNYIQGVNRARGIPRANSLTRLADRFNTDRPSPQHRPPPTLQTSQTMPLPTMTSALAPGPSIRRSARPVLYDEPDQIPMCVASPVPLMHTKQHMREPSRGMPESAMAGLSSDGRYEGRVAEWRKYVGQGVGMPEAPGVSS